MSDDTLNDKARRIEAIYRKYLTDLLALKKRQDAVIEEFTKTLESKKVRKIRKELGLE